MKKTFWSFFEEKTNCTSGCDDSAIKAKTRTATFSRESLDQDYANNALNGQTPLRFGPLTKTATREESDQDASAINLSLQNIPKTITETKEDSDSILTQISQVSWGKKRKTMCTSTESIEEEHARASNFFANFSKTQTRAREESDQDMSCIGLFHVEK